MGINRRAIWRSRMRKLFRGTAVAGTALLVALSLAVPAVAQDAESEDSVTSRYFRPPSTTTPPVGEPLIVNEPRCVPVPQPLGATPLPRPHFKKGLRPNQDLPGSQPEVDNSLPDEGDVPEIDNTLPGDLPQIDNSLPAGQRERLRRLLRLIRRVCGETPPIDETRPEIETVLARGARLQVVRHPTRDWFALVNVATDLAFLQRPGADASPEWASATSGIIAGPGVTNSLVLNDRLVAQVSSPVAVTQRVNDWFPAGVATPRENTPNAPGPGGACTSNLAAISLVSNGAYDGRYKLPGLTSGSLFNTNTPGGCASGANLVRTPSNDPGPSVGLNRADWTNVGFGFSPAGNVRSVGVVRIVWADATVTTQAITSFPVVL